MFTELYIVHRARNNCLGQLITKNLVNEYSIYQVIFVSLYRLRVLVRQNRESCTLLPCFCQRVITSGKTEQSRMNWTCSVVVHSTVYFLMMGRRKGLSLMQSAHMLKTLCLAGAKSTHSVRIWDRVPGGQKLFYRMGENRSQSHLASKAKSYQVQHIVDQFSDIFL